MRAETEQVNNYNSSLCWSIQSPMCMHFYWLDCAGLCSQPDFSKSQLPLVNNTAIKHDVEGDLISKRLNSQGLVRRSDSSSRIHSGQFFYRPVCVTHSPTIFSHILFFPTPSPSLFSSFSLCFSSLFFLSWSHSQFSWWHLSFIMINVDIKQMLVKANANYFLSLLLIY